MPDSILLFDMHVEGHHLEYARRLQTGLDEEFPDAEIDFFAAAEVDRHLEFFVASEFDTLFDDSGVVDALAPDGIHDNVSRAIDSPRDRIVERLFEYVDHTDYDVVHLLHADDLLKEIHRHGRSADPTVLGTLNGAYFKNQSQLRTGVARHLVEVGLTDAARLVPDILSRRGPWNHLNLRRAVRDGAIDDLFVASSVGRDAVRRGTALEDPSLPRIPDPVDPWYELDLDRSDARERLDLSDDEFVLTFFGGLRHEKGIGVLLDALAGYDGPPLTALFAGSPVDVDEDDFEPVRANPDVTVRATLEFVPQDDVPLYFVAADAMAVPYRRSFGQFRPSNVFQKSCSAGRPVIAPSFGVFGKLVTEWNLGTTFEPESPESLRNAIVSVRRDVDAVYDPAQMREYAESQTYERLVQTTAAFYRRCL